MCFTFYHICSWRELPISEICYLGIYLSSELQPFPHQNYKAEARKFLGWIPSSMINHEKKSKLNSAHNNFWHTINDQPRSSISCPKILFNCTSPKSLLVCGAILAETIRVLNDNLYVIEMYLGTIESSKVDQRSACTDRSNRRQERVKISVRSEIQMMPVRNGLRFELKCKVNLLLMVKRSQVFLKDDKYISMSVWLGTDLSPDNFLLLGVPRIFI